MVLLNLRNGTYYGLDETGARIWALLEVGSTVGAVVRAIHESTGADPGSIDSDLQCFLTDLLEHDLIDLIETDADT